MVRSNKNVSRLCVTKNQLLQYPQVDVGLDEIGKEFIPKVYFEEQIAKIDIELRNIPESIGSYARSVVIDMKRGLSNFYKDRLEDFQEEENKQYFKIYKEAIKETTTRAKRKDVDALFRLIKWDKEWLFKDWVKTFILTAEIKKDKKFLLGLSKAILISTRTKRKSHQDDLLLFLRQLRAAGFKFKKPRLVKDLGKFLYERFEDDEKVDDSHPVFKVLSPRSNYFRKFLKRHGFIEDTHKGHE